MKRIHGCLCLCLLMLAGCTSFERVEYHYVPREPATTLQSPQPVEVDRTIVIEVRR